MSVIFWLVSGMFRSMVKSFVLRVLDTDDTHKPEAQVEFLQDFLSKHKYVFSKDFEENLHILKRKHLVDAFLVTNMDGSVVISSEGNGVNEGLVGTAMFSYVKSELPTSEAVMIKKDDGWFILFPFEKKIVIIKAGSELSSIEMKALAVDLVALVNDNIEVIKKKEEQIIHK